MSNETNQATSKDWAKSVEGMRVSASLDFFDSANDNHVFTRTDFFQALGQASKPLEPQPDLEKKETSE